MTIEDKHPPMTTTTEDCDWELVAAIKNAATREERREAVLELAKRNIERHPDISDRLAEK